jgi:predicted small lipoprotein YifL
MTRTTKRTSASRLVLTFCMAVFLAPLTACGLKGNLYIPASQTPEGTGAVTATELPPESGTGAVLETTEVEAPEADPVEPEPAGAEPSKDETDEPPAPESG